jgi:hypothetical protein
MHEEDAQKGNVLFLILIAVALFAALSYAVTDSSRGGVDGGSQETNKRTASEFVQYGISLNTAITRLRVLNQCSNEEISFEIAPFDGAGSRYNANSPADFSCHVFHPAGGGVSNIERASTGQNWQIGRLFDV